MIEEKVEVRTTDGTADGLFYHTAQQGASPGILFFTDIGGIRPSQRALAARICSEGYAVFVPNLFYRTGKPPFFEPGAAVGDEKFKQRRQELSFPLTTDAVERDAVSYIDFLAHHTAAKKERFGVVGLCFAGSFVLRAAAAQPDQIAAAASFHGGALYTGKSTSPHLLLPKIKARLYFGHASNDSSMPQDSVMKFNAALEAWGGRYESEMYEDARHGWTVVDSPAYNPPQAERAFKVLKQVFAETLL